MTWSDLWRRFWRLVWRRRLPPFCADCGMPMTERAFVFGREIDFDWRCGDPECVRLSAARSVGAQPAYPDSLPFGHSNVMPPRGSVPAIEPATPWDR